MARNESLYRGANPNRRRCLLSLCVVALAWLLGPLAPPADARILFSPRRFTFKIEPQTPLKDLLPEAPDPVAVTPPWLVRDLAQVPQILFQKPEATKKDLRPAPNASGEDEKSPMQTRREHDSAMMKTAHVIAKINHLNKQGTDHFLKVLLENRRDLDGCPS